MSELSAAASRVHRFTLSTSFDLPRRNLRAFLTNHLLGL